MEDISEGEVRKRMSETVSEKWTSMKDEWSAMLKEAEINSKRNETDLTEKVDIYFAWGILVSLKTFSILM